MDKNTKLRTLIQREIHAALQEISTTGDVAGYLTPYAFSGEKNRIRRVQQLAKRIGYTLTDRGKEDSADDPLHEQFTHIKHLVENYYTEYKNDNSTLPHQKIGKAISEINKQIKMVERALHFNTRLKNEYGISNDKLWKRTQNQMTKLEGRLLEIIRHLRDLRG
jgi:hypothetical protein